MPTPAEALLEHSTLVSATPWEHLNSQQSGGGSIDAVGPSTANIDWTSVTADSDYALSTNIDIPSLDADISTVLSTKVNQYDSTAEVFP